MVGKVWQCLSARADMHSARSRFEQCQQLWLNLKNNTSSARRDQGQIADELDCVSQSLFRVKEDGFAVQLLPIPLRLLELSRPQTQLPKLPAPLMPLPPFAELSFPQTREC